MRHTASMQDRFLSLQFQVRRDHLHHIGGFILLQPVVKRKFIRRFILTDTDVLTAQLMGSHLFRKPRRGLACAGEHQKPANRPIHAMDKSYKSVSRLVVFFLDIGFQPAQHIFVSGIVALHQHIGRLDHHDNVIILKKDNRLFDDFAHGIFPFVLKMCFILAASGRWRRREARRPNGRGVLPPGHPPGRQSEILRYVR